MEPIANVNAAVNVANNAPPVRTWKDTMITVAEKIWDLVCTLFRAITLGVLLFFNPFLFAISFCYGAIWDQEAERIVKKIEHLVTSQGVFSGFCLTAGAFISLPVTLGAVTVYGGLRLGLYMNFEVITVSQ